MDRTELSGQTIYSAELLYANKDHMRLGVFSTIEIAQGICQADADKYLRGTALSWDSGDSKPDMLVARCSRGHFIVRPIEIDKPLFAYLESFG